MTDYAQGGICNSKLTLRHIIRPAFYRAKKITSEIYEHGNGTIYTKIPLYELKMPVRTGDFIVSAIDQYGRSLKFPIPNTEQNKRRILEIYNEVKQHVSSHADDYPVLKYKYSDLIDPIDNYISQYRDCIDRETSIRAVCELLPDETVIFNTEGEQIMPTKTDHKGIEYGFIRIGDIAISHKPIPTKIIRSNNATVVFWNDDTKTVVKRSQNTPDDPYNAFCAALGIKLYGTNSALKRAIREAGGLPDAQDREAGGLPDATKEATP